MKLRLLLLLAVILMSLCSFALMGIDKHCARNQKRRIPEKTLFLVALCLGAPGGTLGMYVFHHKTRHWYFRLFFPMFAALQLAVLLMQFVRIF